MDFTIKRSRRRTASLEVREDGSVLVRCPLYYPARECEKFVEAKRDWILRQQAALRHDPRRREFSPEEIGELKRRAREYLTQKTEEFANRFGFSYKRVTVTSARLRRAWALFLVRSPKIRSLRSSSSRSSALRLSRSV